MITIKTHFINGDTLDINFADKDVKKALTLEDVRSELCARIKENGFIVVNNMVIPVNNIKYLSVDMPESIEKPKKSKK